MSSACPCGSGRDASQCCEPILQGKRAETPEQLMRARYCAYRARNTAFLVSSWHRSTCSGVLTPEQDLAWRQLHILASSTKGLEGSVDFVATWQQNDRWGQLQEKSRFVLETGIWYYLDGEVTHAPLAPGRNAMCPCGSGLKYKRCCAP